MEFTDNTAYNLNHDETKTNSDKYLENWRHESYYLQWVHRLTIDNNFQIILRTIVGNDYEAILKEHTKAIEKFHIPNPGSVDEAKRKAIQLVLDYMHKSAVRFSYGATNLRVLSGLREQDD